MKVLSLGGAGAVCQHATRDLAEFSDYDEIVIGDYDTDAAEKLAAEIGDPRLKVLKVNAEDYDELVKAFKGFDAEAVAHMTPDDVDALATDKRVIRNRRKLEAIVSNARKLLDLQDEHDSFRAYLRSHGGFEATVKDLRKQFKFLGDMGSFYFLYVVGEEVPSYEEWCASRGREPMPHSG